MAGHEEKLKTQITDFNVQVVLFWTLLLNCLFML